MDKLTDLTLTKDQLEKLLTYVTTDGQAYVQELLEKRARKLEKKQARKQKVKREKELVKNRTQVERANDFKDDLIKNQTKAEMRFKAILKSAKIKYDFQKIFYLDRGFRIVDFFLPDYSVVIEIDGRDHQSRYYEDHLRTDQLQKCGVIDVIRFTDESTMDSQLCINRLKNTYNIGRRPRIKKTSPEGVLPG